MKKRFLTEGEASEYTGIPVNTLRYYRSQRKPPKWTKFNGRVRYDIIWLDKWAEESATEPVEREKK